jgi:hypothetical protein
MNTERPPAATALQDLAVQIDTLAFTLDLAAALLQNDRPHLAALWRQKAEAARRVIGG